MSRNILIKPIISEKSEKLTAKGNQYTFVVDKTAHVFTFGAQNLTDKLYRNATNFIKDLSPEAGRGLKVSYTLRFY
jgi:hypothetical protein